MLGAFLADNSPIVTVWFTWTVMKRDTTDLDLLPATLESTVFEVVINVLVTTYAAISFQRRGSPHDAKIG